MQIEHLIRELKKNKEVFGKLLYGLPSELYYWKQKPEKWCLLEITCHLYDEEREDFKARVKHILESPELTLNPIDPVGWVSEREYSKQDYNLKLNNFLNEREKSIEWLSKLESPNWDNVHRHPKIGNMTAKMVLANWVAHDYLHLRQIIKLNYDYLKSLTGGDLSYAGEW